MFEIEGARFSPRPTKNKCCCSVQGCNSKALRDLTLRFHCFPKPCVEFVNIVDDDGNNVKICRRDAWQRKLLMMQRKITDNIRICSLHFRRSDYILPDAPTQKRYLKRDSVPSCNLPRIPMKALIKETAENDSRQEDNLETMFDETENFSFVAVKSEEAEFEVKTEAQDLETIVELDHCYTVAKLMRGDETKAVVKEEPQELYIKTEPPDSELHETYNCTGQTTSLEASTPTQGPESFEIKMESIDIPDLDLKGDFEGIWQKSRTKERKSEGGGKIYQENGNQTETVSRDMKFFGMLKSDRALYVMCGIPSHDALNKIIEAIKSASPRLAKAKGLESTITDRVVMTFTKLKQGLSYAVLTILFRCSSKKICKKIVLRTLDLLGDCMKCFVSWPPSHEPPSFCTAEDARKIDKIRCVINRVEFSVRKSSTSLHKRTIKFITAVSIDGNVCFVGEPTYGETHKIAFERSNVTELLNKNDAIMIFKDFPIDDYCQENEIRLVRSLFSNKTNNLTISSEYRNRLNINRRIRTFRIFRRKLTSSLCPKTKKILVAICAVHNLHQSTLDKRKINIS